MLPTYNFILIHSPVGLAGIDLAASSAGRSIPVGPLHTFCHHHRHFLRRRCRGFFLPMFQLCIVLFLAGFSLLGALLPTVTVFGQIIAR
jgi:hypothetical protein